jgi:large subunit ribosomal protein L5
MSEMRRPRLEKVVVNIGVGEGGEKLRNAERILEEIIKQKPVRTFSKKTAFGVRKGQPVGCKVTLRGRKGVRFLKESLKIKTLESPNFGDGGDLSFGIDEHTDFPGMKYDPAVGILGMDVCVSLKRPGYRITKRRVRKSKIPMRHRLRKEEAIAFMRMEYGVDIE